MSMEKQVDVKCPECGQVTKATLWSSLNTEVNPEKKAELLNGSLFSFKCPKCGYESRLNYSMLYHNMEKGVMVNYASCEKDFDVAMNIASEMAGKNAEAFNKMMASYIYRIVTTQNSLREKALIFENDLDDRIIESIKCLYYEQLTNEFPDMEPDEILFSLGENGEKRMEFYQKGKLLKIGLVDDGMYHELMHAYHEKLGDLHEDSNAIVDVEWVAKFFGAINN